MGYLLK